MFLFMEQLQRLVAAKTLWIRPHGSHMAQPLNQVSHRDGVQPYRMNVSTKRLSSALYRPKLMMWLPEHILM
jgi:hypothetical protein